MSASCHIKLDISCNVSRSSLDSDDNCGINMLTLKPPLTRGAINACKVRQQALKDGCPYRLGYLQSDSREGARSELPRQRVLRFARRCAGQIRDAAPCLHRQRVSDRSFRRVWSFKANLLPSQGELRHGRDCRIGAGEARSTRSPQDRRQRSGIPAGEAGPGRARSRPGTGEAGPPRTRYRASSQNDRAGIKKKGQVNIAATSACLILSSTITAQYEGLRGAALGEALPLKARSGLMLFLHRGMWGWAQALSATATAPREQIYPSSVAWSVRGGHGAVVHALATIAMSILDRRSS